MICDILNNTAKQKFYTYIFSFIRIISSLILRVRITDQNGKNILKTQSLES